MAYLKSDNTTVELQNEGITYLTIDNGRLVSRSIRSDSSPAALLRTELGWVVLDYSGYRTFVNGLRVADCKKICEGDAIQIGPFTTILYEIRTEVLTGDSSAVIETAVCGFCQCDFAPNDTVVYCPACDSPHHQECWHDNHESCAASLRCKYEKPRRE